ncbi:uncharacterized protein CC84DRAFT_1166536 [Paraphaeosphaeria sporulosa]|uniref:Methyltransferase domain-containing protein n=1 Tax=Paraphaeosphaeria sporulosa TaxID=1460663 RepID=A0A177C7F8_9PLEO|nr:uncharacterized protein CC84DRAFT_1166536 [Paraphaeosphaeria sporulosa]OAG02708.1 hypothetical protein CC84DRAFT_1166536 [Paraphaeosphaeria sporulosa]
MSNASSTSGTAYANLDWTQYIRYRPSYPPSLRELIYRYHTRNVPGKTTAPDASTHWDSLLDIGGGIGISSVPFIRDFRTMHLLDPSPLNHEKARVFLAEHVSVNNLQTKLEFTVAKAEEYANKPAVTAESGVSLAICASTAHFIDPDMLVKAMYRLMRPGGTMAIYSYWLPVFPDLDPGLSVVYTKTVTRAMRLCIRDEATRNVFADAVARLCTGTTVMDAIAVPDDLFEGIQRIQINPQTALSLDTFREDPAVPFTPLDSQVREHDGKYTYVSGTDPEAEGWTMSVDLDFLHGMIRTILPADIQLSKEQHEELYGDLDRAFVERCLSGYTLAMWGLDMILATRRG